MYMCMMLLAATLTFTACGSDDDDDNGGGNNQQQSQNGEVVKDNYYSYTESIEVKNFGTMTCIGEATFDNGQATAMAISFVYPKKSQGRIIRTIRTSMLRVILMMAIGQSLTLWMPRLLRLWEQWVEPMFAIS